MAEKYEKIADVPTDTLASNVVGSLILAKGNLNKYQDLIAYLIRELRGEPHPPEIREAVRALG